MRPKRRHANSLGGPDSPIKPRWCLEGTMLQSLPLDERVAGAQLMVELFYLNTAEQLSSLR